MLNPLFDRIITKNVNPTKTAGGLYLPNDKDEVVRGLVLRVGPDVEYVQTTDIVVFLRKHSLELEGDGGPFLVLQEEAVICTDNPEESQDSQDSQDS